jgi:hypothetical protein
MGRCADQGNFTFVSFVLFCKLICLTAGRGHGEESFYRRQRGKRRSEVEWVVAPIREISASLASLSSVNDLSSCPLCPNSPVEDSSLDSDCGDSDEEQPGYRVLSHLLIHLLCGPTAD